MLNPALTIYDMKGRLIIRLLYFFTLLLIVECGAPNDITSKVKSYKTSQSISGYWSKDYNEGAGYIEINSTNDTAFIEVNSNQIYIKAKLMQKNENGSDVLLFTLIQPGDLGIGGARLAWNSFSRDSIIAKMQILNANQGKFTWLGFYDGHKRVWEYDSDLLPAKNNETKNNTTIYTNYR